MNIVGIDEAGRGSWAGPVVAAAVVLGDCSIPGLTDSKKLSNLKRVQLAALIRKHALASGVGWASHAEVDAFGLTKAVAQAMARALSQIQCAYDKVIIDGNYNFLPDATNVKTIVKADLLIPDVSAASILAKVARDTHMQGEAVRFPGYRFDRHVGYGTAQHIQEINDHGICEIHRRTYKPLRKIMSADNE